MEDGSRSVVRSPFLAHPLRHKMLTLSHHRTSSTSPPNAGTLAPMPLPRHGAATASRRRDCLIASHLDYAATSVWWAVRSAGSFSRSAVVVSTGGTSQLAGIVTATSLVLTLLFMTPYFTHVPKVDAASRSGPALTARTQRSALSGDAHVHACAHLANASLATGTHDTQAVLAACLVVAVSGLVDLKKISAMWAKVVTCHAPVTSLSHGDLIRRA